MEFDNIFNATVLVFWAVLLVPYALKENKKWLIGTTGAAMLVAEILLAINFAHHSFLVNFLVGTINFLLALGVVLASTILGGLGGGSASMAKAATGAIMKAKWAIQGSGLTVANGTISSASGSGGGLEGIETQEIEVAK